MACGVVLITDASKEICEEFVKRLEEESKNYRVNILGKKIDIGITGGMELDIIVEKEKRGIVVKFRRPIEMMFLNIIGSAFMNGFKQWVKNNYGIDVKVKVLTLPRVK